MRSIVLILVCLIALAWVSREHWSQAAEGTQVTPATRPGWSDLVAAQGRLLGQIQQRMATTARSGLNTDLKETYGKAGYWRLVQDGSGIWWFCSPSNHLEFLNTVTHVQPFQYAMEKNGAGFVSGDWAADKSYDVWAQATLQRVRAAGFKGLGAWCHPAFHQLDVPMTQDLNVWTWVVESSRRFYSPQWQVTADAAVKKQVTPLASNRNLVGYYIDNELDWGDGFAGPGVYFDHLAGDDPNRLQVLSVIHEQWPTIKDFNLTWSTTLADYSAVDQWTALPHDNAHAYNVLFSAWLKHLAHDYFATTSELIHKYDQNHLILGVRFRGYAPQEVVSASRGLTDAQSINYYVGDAKLDADMFRMMNVDSGQPIVISEYSFHALDNRSGNTNSVGFVAQVPDQQARADGYRLLTKRLARVPYIVGADWFQWSDEPPGGRGGDGEDVNFGVVDIHDQPYGPLLDAIRQTAGQLNGLHAGSTRDGQQDLWRESYANKPLLHVPFFAQPPKLDADLSTWMAGSKLDGIRREQTVGIERAKVESPNVYVGWSYDGLYLGMEVFDRQIETAPASGGWWTRDYVEWWLSTRPVASDQTAYDAYCHQFFFVPTAADGSSPSGVVGQWHRDGDAISNTIIAPQDIKSAVKILADRYIVSMFIPAEALHGFDPAHQPALAFNIHARDFRSAADFFWSAPKSIQTQLRPNTWGVMYLDAPPPKTAQLSVN